MRANTFVSRMLRKILAVNIPVVFFWTIFELIHCRLSNSLSYEIRVLFNLKWSPHALTENNLNIKLRSQLPQFCKPPDCPYYCKINYLLSLKINYTKQNCNLFSKLFPCDRKYSKRKNYISSIFQKSYISHHKLYESVGMNNLYV